jgi:hypothetical protein
MITASVGKNGANRSDDVKTIQTLLNLKIAKLVPFMPVPVSGNCDEQTILMIEQFQRRVMNRSNPDGKVDVNGQTLARLSEAAPATDPVVNGNRLPDPAAKVLKEILKAAGIPSAIVTSVSRTPADQARVMYENCVLKGAQFNKNMYAAAGDKVVDVFIANETKPRDTVIVLMLAKIIEVGPANVSKHISDTHYTFDVAPSSIPPAKHAKFLEAIKAHKAVSNVIPPPTDPAFHIEIPKNSPHL